MARKKTYYFEPSQTKKVERLAKKLKVTESQVMRMMTDTFSYDLWLTTLKIKQNV